LGKDKKQKDLTFSPWRTLKTSFPSKKNAKLTKTKSFKRGPCRRLEKKNPGDIASLASRRKKEIKKEEVRH